MRVLVVGSGGREHALVRALGRSPTVTEVICAPGNAGIAADARVVAVAADDVHAVVRVAQAERPDLVVVGPEAPLVGGLVDALGAVGLPAFGPTADAARLEGSKAYAKEVMEDAGVPTGGWTRATDFDAALAAIERYPVVIKADGLAAGKGVVIATDEEAATAALEDLLVERRFGTESVVVEEYLEGEELSLLALCDGERAVPLAPARDYKRIFDGDEGPNTGGMGAFSPVAGIDVDEICASVHQPVVDLLRAQGAPFHGVLYAGLMLTAAGPKVLEFNVRFGDPETQAVLPRLEDDLAELMARAVRRGGLAGVEPAWRPECAVTIVMASAGYPESSSTGDEITGLENVPAGVEVTHAGTARTTDGRLVTAGGRVLNITALGADPAAAREAAYAAASVIDFPGKQMRSDVALGAVNPIQ
ncbi:MAG: phosphoribosylamine---glycine ligase [Solirubrobacteraceae bacterium]|nr:phosphoribosylamine---glycine ligase [Solirubrobacteraceae bacterium]